MKKIDELKELLLKGISNVVFGCFACFYLPIFLTKIKQAENPKRLWEERWGNLDFSRHVKERPRVWLHAVSVGEVKAIEPFAEELGKRGLEVVISTVTPTGQQLAQRIAGEKTFYLPFDFTASVRKTLQAVKPDLLLLTETEIWPNLILEAHQSGIPIGIVNGRLSHRSWSRYSLIRPLIKRILSKLSFILVQTDAEKWRYESLGADNFKVNILGNMKFDTFTEEAIGDSQSLKKSYAISPEKRVWVAGSTHPGEERKVLAVFTHLRNVFHDLTLVLVPRHIERFRSLENLVKEFNFQSALATDPNKGKDPFDVLIVNSIGNLKKIYSFADVVWMGGSFIPHGGQNPIEPALFAKPIASGRYVSNFEFVYQELEKNRAVCLVTNEDDLFLEIQRFLNDKEHAQGFGERAQSTVRRLSGASQRTAQWIEEFVEAKCAVS